jgi:multicomponent Na+:H+ antiporter subunit E
MSLFLLNVLLSLAWGALTGQFEPVNLLFGFALGYVMLWLVSRTLPRSSYFNKLPATIEFLLFFIKELVYANLRIAITILSPKMRLRPGVVAVPLDLKSEGAITLLVNLITLTPGTLSLDVSTDRKMLYIHTIWLDDVAQFRHNIKQGYERRVKEVIET